MAYMEFSEATVGASAARAPQAAAQQHDIAPTFSALEWLVIALAERDGLVSIGRAGRFATLVSKLFERAKPGLANSRLEALRRLAVLAWSGRDIPMADMAAFHTEGFSVRQREALLASVAQGLAKSRSSK